MGQKLSFKISDKGKEIFKLLMNSELTDQKLLSVALISFLFS